MPAVSVIIPVFNGEKFLRRSVDSVLGQSFSDLELVIVDDGSTDGSADIAREYARRDSRVRYLPEAHSGGPTHPTNVGIQKAAGKFLAFLDCDDEWLPGKLEKQMRLLEERPEIGSVVCDLRLVKDDGRTADFRFDPEFNRSFALEEMFCKAFFFTFSILVVRKEVMDRVGPLDENFKRAADQDIYLRLLAAAPFGFVNEILVSFDAHSDSTSTLKTAANYKRLSDEAVYMYEKHRKGLQGRNKVLGGLAFRAAMRFKMQNDRKNTRKYVWEYLKLNPLRPTLYAGYFLLFFSGRGLFIER
jgi:glycosyltransferase involved in cell wall biosynthesis